MEDLNFIAAMGVPLGGRYAIDERFTSRFFMFNVLVPDDESLCDIYTTDLSHHLSSFAEKVRICARPIVEIMLTIFRVSLFAFFLQSVLVKMSVVILRGIQS